MTKKLLYALAVVTLLAVVGIFVMTNNQDHSETELLRAQHQEHLDNSPYKETQNLTKEERKAMALPPNAYNEQVWELTMDPRTGRPMTERLMEVQERLRADRINNRGVGGESANPWIDRGPNNQGGRTRGIMFDPNDVGAGNGDGIDYNRVFAGGVSGGLWVNEDITDVNSTWSQVPGIPANISVTVIIADANDTKTFYIGAGESYTSGAAIGRGIWKSTDSGVTWTNIFGGYTGTSSGNQFIDGIFYINDLVARDNAGTTELYAAVAGAYYSASSTSNQWHSLNQMGLYKSTDGGATWTRFPITHPDTTYKNPNDIELDINNNIWFTTTSTNFGNPGGDIYKSTDGITFTLEATIAGASRTELEVSATDANKFWVAANNSGAKLYKTNDAFTTITAMTQPNDVDTGIPASDYTRGQAFYDLPIEADAAGILYVGGIDLFRSTDDGVTWTQISKWSNNNNLATLNNFVHADQHAIVFRPGDDNQVALGNDGGVFFANSMTNAALNLAGAIVEMEKNYNTVQFYYGTIDQANLTPGDDLAGGTQDNGTFFKVDAAAGANGYSDPLTGDGGYTEIDGADGYAVTFYPNNSGRYIAYPALVPFSSIGITLGGGGNFINQAELDTNLDILYTNATSGALYRLERVTEFIPGGPAQTNFYVGSGILTQNPSALKVSPYTMASTTLYVGQRNGVLWKVENIDSGGGTWNTIGTFTGSISDIELGATEMEIYVTMHNYGVVSIWYTSDGGTTWANKEGNFPDMPVKCILQNPLLPNEVIIGTDLGVWATADFSVASPVWVQVYNGMSDVTVLDLDLRTSDNLILAATHGRGLFTSQFTGTVLGVDENSMAKNGIKIFPKVSDGNITVKAIQNLGPVVFDIYNISGQKVYGEKMNLSNINNKISLNLSSGMYIVKIKGETFTVTDRIILK